MKKFCLFLFFLLTVPWLLTTSVFAETSEDARIRELQIQIEALEQQASQFRSNIASEQAKAASLQKEISILKNQIGQIEAQIRSTDVKIDLTKTEVERVQDTIGQTQQQIDQKRETIGRLILFWQQRDNEDLAASLFKYQTLGLFLQQFNDLATMQSQLLDVIAGLQDDKTQLESQKSTLEEKQLTLEELNQQAFQRRSQLASVKGQQDRVLAATKGQEAIYKKQLEEIERRKTIFFNELRELELKIISGGLYEVHIKAETVPPCKTKLFSWPEDGYRLTQGYGMTTYARRGAYGGAPHNGIDVASGYGSTIKAIGAGTIVANGVNNPGWGNWVAIQHPNNMVSLYGHMSSLTFLRVGTQVATGQVIGYEGNTGNVTGSHLHLSLYREFFTYLKGNDLYFNYFEGSLNPSCYL